MWRRCGLRAIGWMCGRGRWLWWGSAGNLLILGWATLSWDLCWQICQVGPTLLTSSFWTQKCPHCRSPGTPLLFFDCPYCSTATEFTSLPPRKIYWRVWPLQLAARIPLQHWSYSIDFSGAIGIPMAIWTYGGWSFWRKSKWGEKVRRDRFRGGLVRK